MNPYQVLKKPILSERSTSDREQMNRYHFFVDIDASKKDIKHAVEKVFEVKVKDVNTSILRGKVKRKGANFGLTKKRKKALITLEKDQKIKMFEEN